MTLFLMRFIGALVLDAGTYEDIEADRKAAIQSVMVVVAVCLAGGTAAIGLGLTGVAGFVTGTVVSLGAWLVWVSIIMAIGTISLPEKQTSSSATELMRVLGFAAAPGVFIALAAMRAAAPVVALVVAVWMIAAAVLAVRQALDYRSTMRAVAVCVIGWLLSFGIIGATLMMFTRPVS
jgi:hypothetical protein